ncbi:MAG TPA: hypothetical protein VGN76_13115 [Gemmatimonadales bacterium]|nr:hypothetical protein [Gemmatimonadales bacterium]
MSKRKDSESDSLPLDPAWQAAWETEDNYWYENFTGRPYALGPDYYDRFRPAFRYGFDSAQHHMGRNWDQAEPDLRQGWESYQHRGSSPPLWEEIKDAVRDAWDRVVGARKTDSERRHPEARE